jgi:hypothetical protein
MQLRKRAQIASKDCWRAGGGRRAGGGSGSGIGIGSAGGMRIVITNSSCEDHVEGHFEAAIP